MTRELELIDWIKTQAPDAGDDCAVLDCEPWGTLLVTTDSVIDGVHAHWARHGGAAFGYKAVARGLSDIAAMAGEPLWALVAACLPEDVQSSDAQGVLEGAQETGCRIVGGDVSFGPTPYVVATVLGRAHGNGPVLRSTARVSDWIVVSGKLGVNDQLRPQPRVSEARALAEQCDIGAMIDLSDGLSADMHNILEASNVGCRLEPDLIPCDDLDTALNRGEDYELLATVRPGELPDGFTRIGEITDARDGARIGNEPLRRGGYEHGA